MVILSSLVFKLPLHIYALPVQTAASFLCWPAIFVQALLCFQETVFLWAVCVSAVCWKKDCLLCSCEQKNLPISSHMSLNSELSFAHKNSGRVICYGDWLIWHLEKKGQISFTTRKHTTLFVSWNCTQEPFLAMPTSQWHPSPVWYANCVWLTPQNSVL